MNDSILYGAKCLNMKSKWIYLKEFLVYLHLFLSGSMLIKHNTLRKQYNKPSKQTYFKSFMDLQKDFLFVVYLNSDYFISPFITYGKYQRWDTVCLIQIVN